MRTKIAVTLTSFAKCGKEPLRLLRKTGAKIVKNKYNRLLNAEEILHFCGDCQGIVADTERYDENTLRKLKHIRVISRCGIGTDSIDLAAARKLDIKVLNTPDAPTIAVAEFTIMLILALLRKVVGMDKNMHRGIWKQEAGSIIKGKRVGIVGFGRIGKYVASLASAFDVEIAYFDPAVKSKKGKFIRTEFKTLLKKSDIVTLHVPYTEKTRGLLKRGEFAKMKKGALLVNCSRGGVVDGKALYAALKSGKLAGAAVDVFEKEPYKGPLAKLPNVIATPHVGSFARESRLRMEIEAVKNLIKGLGS